MYWPSKLAEPCAQARLANAMLTVDEIEKFVVGLNEHPFQIPEKIAAIRTARLIGP